MWLNPVNQIILTAAGCLLAAIVIVRVYQWLQRRGTTGMATSRTDTTAGAADTKRG